MAETHTRLGSVDELKNRFPIVAQGFGALRTSVVDVGELDAKTSELIVVASYVTVRQREGFKVHAGRALKAGASLQELQQAVLLTLGATATLEVVIDALLWIDELNAA